jgi:hypothetical protein
VEERVKIEATMSLQELQERMGNTATMTEAMLMRNALLERDLHGIDTLDVPNCIWLSCIYDATGSGNPDDVCSYSLDG